MSVTRLPRGLLQWQKASGAGKGEVGYLCLLYASYLLFMISFNSQHFLSTYHATTPFNFYINSSIIPILRMRKMRLWKTNYLAQERKLVNEEFEPREWVLFVRPETESLPWWCAGFSTQAGCWTLSQHQTKATGEARGTEEGGCAWRKPGREKQGVASLSSALCSPKAWYQECPTGGVGTLGMLTF